MSVKLRFVRVGKKNHPAYRLCAIESRRARDGQYLENIGFYDPYIADDQKKVRIEKDRVEYWLSVGAQPSETVLSFLKKAKVSGLIRTARKRKPRRKAGAGAATGAAPRTAAAASGAAAGAAGKAGAKPGKKPKPPKKPRPPKGKKGAAPEATPGSSS